MTISETKIKISDLFDEYSDDGESGVYGYHGNLTIRPEFQREFVYEQKQRDAVVMSVYNQYPINVMYWSRVDQDKYELIDGQQRTLSICQFLDDKFSLNINGIEKYAHNLYGSEMQKILDYEITVFICEGTQEEKLDWFKVINTAGMVLTEQELLNATYASPWLSDAKMYFSKRNCVAGNLAKDYITGNPIRQDYLEKTLAWIADRDGLESGAKYMAIHQYDKDASDLWMYFDEVIHWAQRVFHEVNMPELTKNQPWGFLYNKYRNKIYNPHDLYEDVNKLLSVTENAKTILQKIMCIVRVVQELKIFL